MIPFYSFRIILLMINFDIYGALLNGAKLVVIEKDTVTDINKLGNIIKQENIT